MSAAGNTLPTVPAHLLEDRSSARSSANLAQRVFGFAHKKHTEELMKLNGFLATEGYQIFAALAYGQNKQLKKDIKAMWMAEEDGAVMKAVYLGMVACVQEVLVVQKEIKRIEAWMKNMWRLEMKAHRRWERAGGRIRKWLEKNGGEGEEKMSEE